MPRTSPRIPTTVVVKLLNFAALSADALKQYNAEHAEKADAMAFASFGYIETPAGLFVLSTEGVGPGDAITSENQFPVGFAAVFKTPDGERTHFCPDVCIELTPSRVLEFGTGEEQNLAEFIRVWNHRLETNYNIWRREMEKALGLKDAR